MFENLTEKFQRVFKNLRGQGKLTEEHMDAALVGIREALLDGDVNVDVADELLAHIRAKALGSEVLLQLSPDQQVLKIVRDELLELLGVEKHRVRIELAQEAGNSALVEGLFGRDGVGGVLLKNGVGANDGADLRFEIVRCPQGGGDAKQNCWEAKHQSGQIWAISTWTLGKCRGFRMPQVQFVSISIAARRAIARLSHSLNDLSSLLPACCEGAISVRLSRPISHQIN